MHALTRPALAAAVSVFALCTTGERLHAQALEAPNGDVLLTVSGEIGVTNAPDAALFDLDMLRALDPSEIETSTIWTEGTQRFTGVPLATLLDVVGADGSILKATAINDYTVEIPLSDAVPGGALIAFEIDGAAMSRRDKGPLWIVYPYDDSADFRTEVVYSKSIWQLDRIEVVD